MRSELKIEGTFLDYEGLRKQYGLLPSTDPLAPKVDQEFDSFLKKIADKDIYCSHYNAIAGTFDTTFIIPNPDDPTKMVMDFPDGRTRRYSENIGTDKLASIDFDAGDGAGADYLYCTSCGFTTEKNKSYPFEPLFTYNDIWTNNITGNPVNPASITGVTIGLGANDGGLGDGAIFCPSCRGHHMFKELPDSYPYDPKHTRP